MKKAVAVLLTLMLALGMSPVSLAAEAPDALMLKALLEEDAFYVQQGVYRELDTVKEASAGRLLSCFGNNAGSAYIVFSLPAAPEHGCPDAGCTDKGCAGFPSEACQSG